jgi:hypothetical protein
MCERDEEGTKEGSKLPKDKSMEGEDSFEYEQTFSFCNINVVELYCIVTLR